MAFTEALCPKLQQALLDTAGNRVGMMSRERTGFLDSITSQRNRAGFEQIEIGNPNGGTRRIEITFIRPSTRSDTVTSKPDVCPTGREKAPQADIVAPANLFTRYTSALELAEEEVSKICFTSSEEYKADLIMSEMNALATEINATIQTQALNLFGNPRNTGTPPFTYAPPVAPINAPLTNSGTDTANYPGWSTSVKRNLKQIRVNQTPFVVGAGDKGVDLFFDLLEIACCNDQGIDLSQANREGIFLYDILADSVWGQDQFAAFAPGAFQLVTFNEYGTNGGTSANNPRRRLVPGQHEHDVIVDPFTGLEYDFKLNYDNCTERYYMTLGLNFMLWGLPADMFTNQDPMFGVRNSLLFQATQA